ncbi:5-oxoprolinase subunit B family protein [Angustibacter sp. McL0619]|uniref:5-oxoprolinase subunit B family protein n=1 Tax=Angustibacter sp. McL0619 TaxID=3415676 RepID=UPI003CF4B73D
MGDRALVVDLPDAEAVRRLAATLRADLPTGVLDVVPGARSLLLRTAHATDLAPLARVVRAATEAPNDSKALARNDSGSSAEVVVDVRYDGADLAEVARRTGLSVHEVVAAHTAADWRVAFMGFAPGFGYLVGDDPRLVAPRREHPRREVPAGSVALAGEYSGVYPRETPGGWQLIGSTDAPLWDLGNDPPALLRPGLRVRFRDMR